MLDSQVSVPAYTRRWGGLALTHGSLHQGHLEHLLGDRFLSYGSEPWAGI